MTKKKKKLKKSKTATENLKASMRSYAANGLGDEGSTKVLLRPDRGLGWSGAPCGGYYQLVEFRAEDATDRINSPTMYDLIGRALGHHPEFGSEIEVRVFVRVVRRARPSAKKCHNPWPAQDHGRHRQEAVVPEVVDWDAVKFFRARRRTAIHLVVGYGDPTLCGRDRRSMS